ncbi:MAG: T9SS type A sorting domain-containing protein [Bacteroidales bacterium]
MKKNIAFGFILIWFSQIACAQYISPGTGVVWDFDDLVEHAQGAFVFDSSYKMVDDITISANDTLRHAVNAMMVIEEAMLMTIEGVLQLTPPDSIVISQANQEQFFKGFRFENSASSIMDKCIIHRGGGIKLVYSDVLFTNCKFRENSTLNCTGTIDLFHSSPDIVNCEFMNNQGPAVLSAANGESSPYIYNNLMYRNNTLNTNMPQINLGTSDGVLPIRIIKNTVEGFYTNSGGIAITTLAGGSVECIIDSNMIFNNRYGITAYGFDINSIISNNEIYDNNIENLPMQGGSGINYWGGTSNTSMVFKNKIYGNLWGITITGDALPNLGQIDPDTINIGHNKFFDNGNNEEIFALYNNTPNAIYAENNYWGYYDQDSVENVIFHYPDDETLGFVDYLPYVDTLLTSYRELIPKNIYVFPNPANNYFIIERPEEFSKNQEVELFIYNSLGKLVHRRRTFSTQIEIDISSLPAGLYPLRLSDGISVYSTQLIKN